MALGLGIGGGVAGVLAALAFAGLVFLGDGVLGWVWTAATPLLLLVERPFGVVGLAGDVRTAFTFEADFFLLGTALPRRVDLPASGEAVGLEVTNFVRVADSSGVSALAAGLPRLPLLTGVAVSLLVPVGVFFGVVVFFAGVGFFTGVAVFFAGVGFFTGVAFFVDVGVFFGVAGFFADVGVFFGVAVFFTDVGVFFGVAVFFVDVGVFTGVTVFFASFGVFFGVAAGEATA